MDDYDEYGVHIDSVGEDGIRQFIWVGVVLMDTMYNIISDEEYDAMDIMSRRNLKSFLVLVDTKVYKNGKCEIIQEPYINDDVYTSISYDYNKEAVMQFAIKEAKKTHPHFFDLNQETKPEQKKTKSCIRR